MAHKEVPCPGCKKTIMLIDSRGIFSRKRCFREVDIKFKSGTRMRVCICDCCCDDSSSEKPSCLQDVLKEVISPHSFAGRGMSEKLVAYIKNLGPAVSFVNIRNLGGI